ncbi:MAG: LytTR family transcriptional regulator [Alphaproteobacteria bacterium]|nr:MAG: LytTR family transcriptional regulator [Alphaproteobacteria bacterium]
MGTPVGKRASSTVPTGVEDAVTHLLALFNRRSILPVVQWVGFAVIAGTLLAILGPFGSYMNGGPIRLFGYWIGAMLLGLGFYGTAYRFVAILTVIGSRASWIALIVASLLASIPQALATRMVAFRLWPALARLDIPPGLWFVQTATIGMVAMTGVAFIQRRSWSASHDDAELSASAAPITAPLGGEVLALQMEDHYVRVHRPAGSELILMPLGRAIEAVEADGLRTHRSWWVAAHAVAAVEGNARSMRLKLSNGLVAPVARSAVTHLKAAGWIKDTEGGAA